MKHPFHRLYGSPLNSRVEDDGEYDDEAETCDEGLKHLKLGIELRYQHQRQKKKESSYCRDNGLCVHHLHPNVIFISV